MIETVHAAYMKLVQLCWRSLPLLITIGFVLLAAIPVHVLHGVVPLPNIAAVSLYFWAINGPVFMPPWAVFLLGLTHDLLSGTPLGFWVVIYLAAYGFTLTQRVFFRGRTGIGAWLGFALIMALVTASAWLVGMLVLERWLDPAELVLQAVVTLVLYPFFARLFSLLRRLLTTAPESL